MSARHLAAAVLAVAPLAVALFSCTEPGTSTSGAVSDLPLRLADLSVQLPADAGPGLLAAGADLTAAVRAITGQDGTGRAVLRVEVAADAALGPQGYRIRRDATGLRVAASTQIGAMYGIYRVIQDLGVQYLHPSETFTPSAPDAPLPDGYTDRAEKPAFERRGFHHHTQHPIPMSDYLLRPGREDFRDAVSRRIRWLARNRQNALSFHALNTLDLDTWLPYIRGIATEAAGLGVDLGVVVSFADQQQHNFKLVRPEDARPEDVQIRTGLDRMLEGGFRFVTFQIGTSEFTPPPDGAVLRWLDTAVAHLGADHPDVRPYAWIHITCGLTTPGGGRFFHQPLQSPARLGAMVHTTMFYTLSHPAPVYGCEDFSHQLEFMTAADGQREQIFFPETAWWLGFDNNLPLELPLTGWSRQQDVVRILAEHDVRGHITFTTGREWGYWRYDHFLTRLTWDATLTWDAYLQSIEPAVFPGFAAVTRDLTALQRTWLYERRPELIFYLSGELPQDEVGATAGLLARRPKIAFPKVLQWDAAAFAAWRDGELADLRAMGSEIAALVARLPATCGGEGRCVEAVTGIRLLADRVAQAVALYDGVVALRSGDETTARARLAEARALSAGAIDAIHAVEAFYRDPAAILREEKPETLTVYPFGYLWETHTGYFWTRRDDQLAALLDAPTGNEPWASPPDVVLAADGAAAVSVTQPDDPLLAGLLPPFIPPLLIAVTGTDPVVLTLAQDADRNGTPDTGTQLALSSAPTAFSAIAAGWDIAIHDAAGGLLGTLRLEPLTVTAAFDSGAPTQVDLAAEVESSALIAMIQSVAGIDTEGLSSLMKASWGLDPSVPLPARLPVGFRLTPSPLTRR